MRTWGSLPDEVITELHAKEWGHAGRLRSRLLGDRPFPITVPLKPPTGVQALADISHFHAFLNAWRHWPKPHQITWSVRRYRQLGEHQVPACLKIDSMQDLFEALGPEAVERSHLWTERMRPFLEIETGLFPLLVRQLSSLEQLTAGEARLLASVLPQLRQGMGNGLYLRAIPLAGADTKFVETHAVLLAKLLDGLHCQQVSLAGGLEPWLGCKPMPVSWLFVRPLCADTCAALGGQALMMLAREQLLERPLPGQRILVVENHQSGFALPSLPNTVAVFGGGLNTAWMQAGWLSAKDIGYWGDIDTWGLKILSDVRQWQPHAQALMMDRATVDAHLDRVVAEPMQATMPDAGLSTDERELFCFLREADGRFGRLEQERLSQDYITSRLRLWAGAGL